MIANPSPILTSSATARKCADDRARHTIVTSIDQTTPASAATALHRRGLMLVAGAAIVWSSGGLLARLVTADPWTILFWRSVFACLFLLGYAWFRNRGRLVATFRELGWPGVVLGLCFATASSCFIIALSLTSVANIMFIQSSAPVIAGLLGWVAFTLDGGLRVEGVALRRSWERRPYLAFPERITGNGQRRPILFPTDRRARMAIEAAVLAQLPPEAFR